MSIPDKFFAPYVDATSYSPFYDISDTTGISSSTPTPIYYVLGFICWDNYQNCNIWGSDSTTGWSYDVPNPPVPPVKPGPGNPPAQSSNGLLWQLDKITALRKTNPGSDVIISFGGQDGSDIAQYYSNLLMGSPIDQQSIQNTADAYATIIDLYSLKIIDFDIEGTFAQSTSFPISQLRNRALSNLKKNPKYANLKIHFTLPVLPKFQWYGGLDQPVLDILSDAQTVGLKIDVVNLMTMAFGTVPTTPPPTPNSPILDPGLPPFPGCSDYAKACLSAVIGTQLQLLGLPKPITGQVFGITPRIGVDANPINFFTLADAKSIVDFANTTSQIIYTPTGMPPQTIDLKINRLSFWSANFDAVGVQQSPSDDGKTAPYAYTKAFMLFNAPTSTEKPKQKKKTKGKKQSNRRYVRQMTKIRA
jgi:hypothetical protein